MRQIIAIGGGGFGREIKNLKIEKYIISQSNKKNPAICFIPTATGDDDGYINNNSFRGYRGLWYHSYGLNSALGHLYLAKLWGAEVPETVIKKVTKAAKVLNLGIKDYEKFSSRKYDGDQLNNNYKKKNARMHTHQEAIAIDTLMKLVTGVILENDPIYLRKRKKKGIDDLVGFNANCIK